MKNILYLPIFYSAMSLCFAIGPNELTLNGIKYIKTTEKSQQNSHSAVYAPVDKNASLSIIITHVLNKNEPKKIVQDLKKKKSVEVIEVNNINDSSSDLLISFIQFDMQNLKVKNNLCRIKKNPNIDGSVVFQYVDTNKLKSQSEGTALPDFTEIADNMKQLPIDKYLTSLSQTKTFVDEREHHIPWFKRPGARAGISFFSKGGQTHQGNRYQENRPY